MVWYRARASNSQWHNPTTQKYSGCTLPPGPIPVAHTARAYPSFCSPPDGMLVHHSVFPSTLCRLLCCIVHFTLIVPLSTQVRGTMRVKCLTIQHNHPNQGSNPDHLIRSLVHYPFSHCTSLSYRRCLILNIVGFNTNELFLFVQGPV